MTKVRVKLNRKGVRELLKSDELRNVCAERAQNAMAHLGSGYETNTYVGKTRASAMVYPSSAAARQDNYRNNTLLKAFGGALKVRDKE